MAKTWRSVLNAHRRRGYILQGDPGTGKTVSIHKLIMQFTDTPVFWISSDAISDTKKMRSVFRILNMFPGSIFVFDDIDGNDFSGKTNLTTTFITCIDETNSKKFSGIIIMTINEPQRVHATIKTRNGRIDEVIHVKNPETFAQVLDVITQRYKCLDAFMPNWMMAENEEFKKLVQTIIDANFTHAHIAGIISDLVELYPDGYDINDFASAVNKRIQSIANAAMVTGSDGHIVTAKSK
jgi:ATP-dependent 26S proteasome regulatory subunit